MTRILVVDDHHFVRGAVVEVVNDSADLDVVGECADGSEVAAAVRELQPDVVVMDIRMPRMSGLEATALLQRDHPPVRVILHSSDTAAGVVVAARESGAVGYLAKGLDPGLVRAAIRQVAAGGTAWPEEITAAAS